jgi:regulatory protein
LQVTVQPKAGHQERWEIFIEGEKWREVHRSVFGRHPRFPSVNTRQEWQKAFDSFEYQRVRNYVVWRLSTQSYHSEQLGKLLRDRLVQHQTIERVLEECKASGYLNDEAWMQAFMRSQQKRYSLRVILSKLRTKGFSSETLHRLALEWENPEEEQQAIQHLLHTRYRSKDLSQYKERQKVIAALLRKGYAFDQVQAVLKREDWD